MVGVVVPVYNVEKYIERCIDSIIHQSYKNLEIILVDDGSTDKSGDICDRFSKEDSRIHVIHQKNGGLSSARNTGIMNLSAEYAVLVDGDDFIDCEMIEKLTEAMAKTAADLVIGSYRLVDETGNELPNSHSLQEEVLTTYEMLDKLQQEGWVNYTVAWNKLYKTEILKSNPFPVGKINEDTAVVHRIIGSCTKIAVISDYIYNYVQRNNSIMNSNITVKRMDILDAWYDRIMYYTESGYDEFVQDTFELMRESFELRRFISITDKNDVAKLKDATLLIRKAYKNKNVKSNIRTLFEVYFPEIYFAIKKICKL